MPAKHRIIDMKNLYHRLPRSIPILAILAIVIMLVAGLQPTIDHRTRNSNSMDEEPSILGTEPVPDSGLPWETRGRGEGDPIEMTVDALIEACDNMTDTDGDGLPDSVEAVLGTKSEYNDTDGDGLDDNYEARTGLDPLEHDSNGDGMSDYMEIRTVPSFFNTGWEIHDVECAPKEKYVDDVTGSWDVRSIEQVHQGNHSFKFNGSYNGDQNENGIQYLYLKIFDVDIAFGKDTRLSYWIYHDNYAFRKISIDGKCTDGSTIRDANKDDKYITDQYGVWAHPDAREDPVNEWYFVEFDLTPLEGKTLNYLMVAFDHQTNDPGNFRVYIDGLRIWENDIDGDGSPNAWDPDNDGDGVVDDLDISPNTRTDMHDSFQFQVATNGNPTYMDFQIRPEDPEHLKLFGQTYDWPHDNLGQIQDRDDSEEDITIRPMLEMRVNKLPSQSEANNYGIMQTGGASSAPAVTSWGRDRLDLFVKGSDDAIWHRGFDGTWPDWDSLGGEWTSVPAVASWGSNRLDVFARGQDNALWHKSWNGQWSGWDNLGGYLTSAPAAVSWGSGRIDVFVRDTGYCLSHKAYENGWSGWDNLGGYLTSAPTAASWEYGRLDVFVRDAGYCLSHKSYENGWSSWGNLGGDLTSAPAAVSRDKDMIDVFVKDSSNAIGFRQYSSGWADWGNMSGPLNLAYVPLFPVEDHGTPVAFHGKMFYPAGDPLDLDTEVKLTWMVNAYSDKGDLSSTPIMIEGGLGTCNAGAGTAMADINGNGIPDVVFMGIDNPSGANEFRYKIGWDLRKDGSASSWSGYISIAGLGYSNDGGGIAIADINGNGTPDMVLMGIDDSSGANSFWYRVLFDLQSNGHATTVGSTNIISGLGYSNDGGGAAIGDINRNGRPDLLLMGVDDGSEANNFWYRIGWDLGSNGIASSWGGTIQIGGTGWETDGGGTALADVNGNGVLDLILMSVDDPSQNNDFRYLIGYDLATNGLATLWSPWVSSPGLAYSNVGGGIALADIDGNGNLDILLMAVDDASGADSFWYKVGWNIQPEQTIIAHYKEDFSITGFRVEENYGADIGFFSSDDRNQTLSAFLVLRYEFLKSQNNLSDVPDELEEHNVSVSRKIGSFTHLDEALMAASDMAKDIMDDLPGGKVLPLVFAMKDVSTVSSLEEFASGPDYVAGNDFNIDMALKTEITMKSLAMYWYNTTLNEIIGSDEILDEVRTWDKDDINETADMLLLFYLWQSGETEITKVGDYEFDFKEDELEKSEVFEILEDFHKGFSAFEHVLAPIVEKLASFLETQAFLRVKNAFVDYLGNEVNFAQGDEVDELMIQFKAAQNAKTLEEVVAEGAIGGEIGGTASKLATFAKVLKVVGVLLVIAVALYTFFSIAVAGGWSRFSIFVGLALVLMQLIYLGIMLAIFCWIPVVGTAIGLLLILADIIATFGFHKGSGWIMEKILDALTDYTISSEVDLEMMDTSLHIYDNDDNGLTVGDRIMLYSLIYGKVFETSDGSDDDVTDSYIIPQYHYRVSDTYNDCLFRNIASYGNYGSWREVEYETGVWIEPGVSMINFPLGVALDVYYKVYYKECFIGICSRKSYSASESAAINYLYFDVLPSTFDEFLTWTAITPIDNDHDNLPDSEEGFQQTSYRIVQNATGKVIDGSDGSMYMLDWKDSENQKWDLEALGDGYYKIIQKATGKVIDGNGESLSLLDWNGGDHQRWKLDYEDHGYYTISQKATGNAIDGNGNDLYQHDPRGDEYQKWKLEPVESGTDTHKWDTDGDGISDSYETSGKNGYFMDPASSDTDGDGLYDRNELELGTSPVCRDSDGDGLTDFDEYGGWKITFEYCGELFTTMVYSNPLINDSDDDGLDDGEEYRGGLNPRSADTNGDGFGDADYMPYIPSVTDYIRNVELNDGGNMIIVSPGDDVEVSLDYRIWNKKATRTEFWSNNKMDVNLDSSLLQRIYDDEPEESPDVTTGSSEFSLTAPTTEGMYFLTYDITKEYHVKKTIFPGVTKWFSYSVTTVNNEKIGVIKVESGTILRTGTSDESGGEGTFSRGEENWTALAIIEDRDTDGDGITDHNETGGWVVVFTNSSNETSALHVTSDQLLPDSDHDGLSDLEEYMLQSDPRNVDTDGDGLSDLVEKGHGTNATHHDTDGDGLDDGVEITFGSDPFQYHSDLDGLTDHEEFMHGCHPKKHDSDDDGVNDSLEIQLDMDPRKPDSDEDLLSDAMELAMGTDPRESDTDGDGIFDGHEVMMNMSPLRNDTDADGILDAEEIELHTDPLSNDTDGDGLLDMRELELGTDPLRRDTDNDGVNDLEDHDSYTPHVKQVILVSDPNADTGVHEFAEKLGGYTNVKMVSPDDFLKNHTDARYIVIVGRPDAPEEGNWTYGNGRTAGSITYDLLNGSGETLSLMQESDHHRLAVEYGIWNSTQTIVMLSYPYHSDHWRVLHILKGMNVTIQPDSKFVEYPSPRNFYEVDAIKEMDTFIYVDLEEAVTPTTELTNYTDITIPTLLDKERGLERGGEAIGKYLGVEVSENVQNETVDIINWAWVQIFYTVSDLDRTGDGDTDDTGDFNESTLCVYYFDESTNSWIRLSEDLDWVFEVGVNTTNVTVYGKEYEGYVWVNVSHFCLFGLAGESTLPPGGEGDQGSGVVLWLLIAIVAILIGYLLWMPNGRGKKNLKKEVQSNAPRTIV